MDALISHEFLLENFDEIDCINCVALLAVHQIVKAIESSQRDFRWHGIDPRIVSLLSVNLIEAQNEEVSVYDLINQKHGEA